MGSFKPVRTDVVRDSDEVQRALDALAEAGADAARLACPHGETGDLAESIDHGSEKGRAAFWYGLARGIFPELGTRFQPAQAFMRGAGLDGAKRAAR